MTRAHGILPGMVAGVGGRSGRQARDLRFHPRVETVLLETTRSCRAARSGIVPVCLVVVPSLLAAPWISLPLRPSLAAAAFATVTAVTLLSKSRRRRWPCDITILLAVISLAIGWGSHRRQPSSFPIGLPEMLISGSITNSGFGAEAGDVRFHWDGSWHNLPGRFQWCGMPTGNGGFLARGYLAPLSEPRLPGLADRDRSKQWQGLRGRIIVKQQWSLSGEASTDQRGFRASVREALDRRIGWSLPESVRALLPKILWGERTEIDPEIERCFKATGTMHLLAISGLHVTLLAMLFEFALRLLMRRPLLRLMILLCALLGYVLLVGPRPSVIRSSTMAACILIGRSIGRTSSVTTAWWIALLLIACIAPGQLASAGGQLSFVATGALIQRRSFGRWLDLPSASLIATAATSGILWAHFGVVAPLAVVANLIAIPSLGPVLVSFLWGLAWGNPDGATLQAIAWGPARIFSEAWLGPLRLLVPIGEATTIRVSGGELAGLLGSFAFLGLLLAIRLIADRRLASVVVIAGVSLPFLVSTISARLAANHRCDLEVVALTVGQGDSILLRTGTGRAYLVDTGSGGRDRMRGRDRLAPALRSLGVERLHGVFLTHGDEDHVGGFSGLLHARIRVDSLYLSKGDVTRLRIPKDRIPPFRVISTPWELVDGPVKIRLLAPTLERQQELGNEGSLVLRVEAPGGAMILPGDLGEETEERLAESGRLEPAAVILAGHHGSGGSTGDVWCETVRPRLAIVSCGLRNRHGHPAASVLDRLNQRGVEVCRTDFDGSISLRWKNGTLSVRSGGDGCRIWRPVI